LHLHPTAPNSLRRKPQTVINADDEFSPWSEIVGLTIRFSLGLHSPLPLLIASRYFAGRAPPGLRKWPAPLSFPYLTLTYFPIRSFRGFSLMLRAVFAVHQTTGGWAHLRSAKGLGFRSLCGKWNHHHRYQQKQIVPVTCSYRERKDLESWYYPYL